MHLAHAYRRTLGGKKSGDSMELGSTKLKLAIASCIKQMFGTIAVSTHHFDILSIDRQKEANFHSAIIRVHTDSLTLFWGALAMCTAIDKVPCQLIIAQSSTSLVDIASPRYLQ
ncbi:hypothetical protein AC1031_010604 [Aphanomyces cochlioides]|nr:hypothetical protein AC1031_010604 [Aphanomyces cochlioides]